VCVCVCEQYVCVSALLQEEEEKVKLVSTPVAQATRMRDRHHDFSSIAVTVLRPRLQIRY
jgi:hypothetical protein